ncbi:MAG TPA: sulfotransferase [Candidatus Hodarchaeales archaeon]|nr:sulfotransferase [Candidatus Hodarchaeales archaeon]
MAKPIFIVGTPRSGTTWLANMLGNHSKVACVRQGVPGERGGTNESAFFSYVDGKFGNLKNDNNLIQLIETFGASTFFILSGADKSLFYKNRPQTYKDFFRLLMDHLAEKQGAEFWLEKTPSHTFHLKEMSGYYQDAKFIALKRNIIDQIGSFLKIEEFVTGVKTEDLPFLKKKLRLFVRIFKYYAHTKHLDNFITKSPDKILQIDYETLRESTREVMGKVCDFLGIDFEEPMLEGYIRNTGFQSDDERKRILSSGDVTIIQVLSFLMKLVPYTVYRLAYLAKQMLEGRSFPYWFFSYNIEKYGWRNVFGKGVTRVKFDGKA